MNYTQTSLINNGLLNSSYWTNVLRNKPLTYQLTAPKCPLDKLTYLCPLRLHDLTFPWPYLPTLVYTSFWTTTTGGLLRVQDPPLYLHIRCILGLDLILHVVRFMCLNCIVLLAYIYCMSARLNMWVTEQFFHSHIKYFQSVFDTSWRSLIQILNWKLLDLAVWDILT